MQKLTTEDTKAHRAAKAAKRLKETQRDSKRLKETQRESKRLETSVFLCGKAFDLDL
jgi:phage host-nuclease inhibitor protein Gam